MDESAFSDINAHMAEGSAQGVEKHQIAGLKFVLVDGLGDRGLFFGVVRQDQAQGACGHGADKTAAIKTGDAGAAAFVGDAQNPMALTTSSEAWLPTRWPIWLISETTKDWLISASKSSVSAGAGVAWAMPIDRQQRKIRRNIVTDHNG